MDAPTPWQAYARPAEAPGVARRALAEAKSNRGRRDGAVASGESVGGLTTDPRWRPRAGVRRPRVERAVRAAEGGAKHAPRVVQARCEGRFAQPHLIGARFKRNPVYDRPFGVLDHHVLSGARDREAREIERAAGAARAVRMRLPASAASRHGGRVARPAAESLHRLKFLASTDARAYFRLWLPRSDAAARRLQGWWRGILARRKMAELRELFTVTRFDHRTGLWYRANMRTGASEWIY